MLTEGGHRSDEFTLLISQLTRQLEIVRNEIGQSQLLLQQVAIAATQMRESSRVNNLERLLLDQNERLLSALGAQLHTSPTAASHTDFRMDLVGRVARVGRREIRLSEKEFAVLELLWKRSPKPVSREDLLLHLYGESDQPSSQVIDMFILRIRQKFAAAEVTDVAIRAEKGAGWWLDHFSDSASAPGSAAPSKSASR